MSDSPVGIVVPLYNKGRFIGRAIDSILRQAHTNWQLTIVDDGSTDNGPEELSGYRDERIHVLHTENRGLGAARNLGLRETPTEWVALLDADDEWEPEFLSAVIAPTRLHEGLVAVFADATARNATIHQRKQEEGVLASYFEARMERLVGIHPSAVLVHRQSLLDLGGFREERLPAEDIEAWFRLVCAGPMYYVSSPLARIETEDAGQMTRTTDIERRVAGLRRMLAAYDNYARSGKIPAAEADACKRYMEHQRGRIAVALMSAGLKQRAVAELLSGVPFGRHTRKEYWICLRRLIRPRFI
jgi:glycosyltransferase involved in cell wall biosynthesis